MFTSEISVNFGVRAFGQDFHELLEDTGELDLDRRDLFVLLLQFFNVGPRAADVSRALMDGHLDGEKGLSRARGQGRGHCRVDTARNTDDETVVSRLFQIVGEPLRNVGDHFFGFHGDFHFKQVSADVNRELGAQSVEGSSPRPFTIAAGLGLWKYARNRVTPKFP